MQTPKARQKNVALRRVFTSSVKALWDTMKIKWQLDYLIKPNAPEK
jgi:hypothetical protein